MSIDLMYGIFIRFGLYKDFDWKINFLYSTKSRNAKIAENVLLHRLLYFDYSAFFK